MNIERLRQILNNNIATVTFEKKDGSIREMLCTTMAEFLPERTAESSSKPSETVVTIWDLEKAEWRSFRFDSLESIYIS